MFPTMLVRKFLLTVPPFITQVSVYLLPNWRISCIACSRLLSPTAMITRSTLFPSFGGRIRNRCTTPFTVIPCSSKRFFLSPSAITQNLSFPRHASSRGAKRTHRTKTDERYTIYLHRSSSFFSYYTRIFFFKSICFILFLLYS